MADIQNIREVSAAFKRLDPAHKLYITGYMKGVLDEREKQQRESSEENKAS